MPPRVVIGAGRPNKLPALVCEYTIRKHCPDAEVVHTYDRPFLDGTSRRRHRDRWEEPCGWLDAGTPLGTMFSFARHMVPEICGHEGRAIYLDADMILFASVQELWDMPMGGAWVLRVPGQFAVAVLDCEALEPYPIRRLLREFSLPALQQAKHLPRERVATSIPPQWNHTDRYAEGTKLLHYTNMRTQPWVEPGHRGGGQWFSALAEAVASGAISEETVREEVRDGKAAWVAATWPQPHVLRALEATV